MGAGVITQCPHCRALMVVGAVVVDGSLDDEGTPRAGLSCGVCGAVAWLPLTTTMASSSSSARLVAPSTPALSSPSDPELAPATAIDAAPSSSSTTVAAQSLVPKAATTAIAAGFDADVVERVVARFTEATEGQAALAERFDVLVRDRWSSDADHSSLLKAAAVSGELAFIGGRYRCVLDVVADEPRARTAQKELITLAMATMSTQSSMEGVAGDPRLTTNVKFMMGALLFLVIGGGVFMVAKWFMASLTALDAQ